VAAVPLAGVSVREMIRSVTSRTYETTAPDASVVVW